MDGVQKWFVHGSLARVNLQISVIGLAILVASKVSKCPFLSVMVVTSTSAELLRCFAPFFEWEFRRITA